MSQPSLYVALQMIHNQYMLFSSLTFVGEFMSGDKSSRSLAYRCPKAREITSHYVPKANQFDEHVCTIKRWLRLMIIAV